MIVDSLNIDSQGRVTTPQLTMEDGNGRQTVVLGTTRFAPKETWEDLNSLVRSFDWQGSPVIVNEFAKADDETRHERKFRESYVKLPVPRVRRILANAGIFHSAEGFHLQGVEPVKVGPTLSEYMRKYRKGTHVLSRAILAPAKVIKAVQSTYVGEYQLMRMLVKNLERQQDLVTRMRLNDTNGMYTDGSKDQARPVAKYRHDDPSKVAIILWDGLSIAGLVHELLELGWRVVENSETRFRWATVHGGCRIGPVVTDKPF